MKIVLPLGFNLITCTKLDSELPKEVKNIK